MVDNDNGLLESAVPRLRLMLLRVEVVIVRQAL